MNLRFLDGDTLPSLDLAGDVTTDEDSVHLDGVDVIDPDGVDTDELDGVTTILRLDLVRVVMNSIPTLMRFGF